MPITSVFDLVSRVGLPAGMPLTGVYEPSTYDFVREQVELYERTGGREGATIDGGGVVVILTTIGARSGALRKSAVMRIESGGIYAAVGSVGGQPQHPGWYRNLLGDPRCELQDGPAPRDMLARDTAGEEYRRWWDVAVAAFPHYAELQAKTDRTIPVVLLEPAAHPH